MTTQHAEGTFTGAGGIRLFEQSWRPAVAPKAAIVVVHGLKDHSGRYAAVAERLAEAGYAVHAFDLRGHGKSEGRRAFVRSFDEYLDDLATFVAAVRAREPGRPLWIFGHSLGGAIVTLFALTRDDPFQGIALSAPALKVTNDISPGRIRLTMFFGKVFPKAGVFKLRNANFSRDPKVVAEMDRDPLIYQKAAAARTASELLRAMARIQEKVHNLSLPLLLMHGTADRLANPEGSRELYGRASSADKTLKLYDGLYHDLFHEPEGEHVFADWFDWLQARANRP